MHDLIDGETDKNISYHFNKKNKIIDGKKNNLLKIKYEKIINKPFTYGLIKEFCLESDISHHDFRQDVLELFSDNTFYSDYKSENFNFIIFWLNNVPYL